MVKGQIPVQRSTSGVTVMDSRLKANLNLVGPAYHDTTAANVQKGLDSLGAIIYDSTHNIYWFRGWNGAGGKKWVTFGGSSLTNPMTTKGDIIYENAALAPDRLAGNTTTIRRWLNSTGTGAAPNLPFYDTLASSDITNALGYTPYPSTNPNGYISSLTLPPLYLKNGLHARDSVTAVLGGSLDSITLINGKNTYPITFDSLTIFTVRAINLGADVYSKILASAGSGILETISVPGDTLALMETVRSGTNYQAFLLAQKGSATTFNVAKILLASLDSSTNIEGPHIVFNQDTTTTGSYIRFNKLKQSNDSTTYKPLGIDASGNIKKMSNWSGGSGGGGSTLTRQNITSGSSHTVTGGNYLVQYNYASVQATETLTLPASPADQDIVDIQTGSTIAAPNAEITSFTISPNSGQTINSYASVTAITLYSGAHIKLRYNSTGTFWDRLD